MRSILLFVAGVLVGANLVYFLLVRPGVPAPPAAIPATTGGPAEMRSEAAATIAPPVTPPDLQVEAPGPQIPATDAPPSGEPAAAPVNPAIASPPATVASTIPTPPAGPPAIPEPTAISAATNLAIPVSGVAASQLDSTFNDARGSERRHEALDIMAPRGTPVVAVRDGKVAKLFDSKPGGLTIYQFDPTSTYAYYYAHLDRYAPGLAEGKSLRRGDVIGYVGSTGNANPEAPHLHFAIFRLGPEKQWWKGTAIDPYPLLGGN